MHRYAITLDKFFLRGFRHTLLPCDRAAEQCGVYTTHDVTIAESLSLNTSRDSP